MALLDHSGNAQKKLLDGIVEVKATAIRTGKMQRLTMIREGGELGVSFLAMDSSHDQGNLARQLEFYTVVQEYAERCPSWVAMAGDVASARIVDLCMFLSAPWQQDEMLDQLADRFIPTKARKT